MPTLRNGIVLALGAVAAVACGLPIDSLATGDTESDLSATIPSPDLADDASGSWNAPVTPQADSSVAEDPDTSAPALGTDSSAPFDAALGDAAKAPPVDAGGQADGGVRCRTAKDCPSETDVCVDLGVINLCISCEWTLPKRDAAECKNGEKCRVDKGKLACQ